MKLGTIAGENLHRNGFHPRRWLKGLIAYSRYMGYVRPELLSCPEEEYRVRRKIMTRGWSARALLVPVGRTILALSPHPDDESIGAGGFLLAHKDRAAIHFICVCNGEAGGSLEDQPLDSETARRRMVEVRRGELRRVADAVNAASVHHLDFPDGNVPYDDRAVNKLRSLVKEIRPDVVLLPWFLDDHVDHRRTNVLYAWGCADLEATVIGYEVWSLTEPNAVLDISPYLEGKLALIQNHVSQLRTDDYDSYAKGLAQVRGFQHSLNGRRGGAAEAYIALPNREYCELVCHLYGEPGRIKESALELLGISHP
jgi:LmbE family N-acetylglucosaminyl deacetylase